LKSESEERETWTAESLRAASSNGEGFGFFRAGEVARKRLRRSTFQVNTVSLVTLRRGRNSEWDLVKRCDQPGKVLSNLRV
jgi:hypothetical protein